MSRRLHVDRTRCDGYGLCAQFLPELVGLDEWGFPILCSDTVPEHLLDLARRAVEGCPVLALRLEAGERRGHAPAIAARSYVPRAGGIGLQAIGSAPHTGGGRQGGG